MPFHQFRRREFLGGLGGAAAWPLAAHAQQRPLPMVGVLLPTSPDTNVDRLRVFRAGLKEAGFVEGENVAIEYRWADGQNDRLPALAADLVRRQVSVIASPLGVASALAAKAATTTIPIVFAIGDDPVRFGLVASLARPGGNLTGFNYFNSELVAKRLELLHELVPAAARVALLFNPASVAQTGATLPEVQAAARAIRLETHVLNASTSGEINAAFATFDREPADALFVAGDTFFNSRRVQLVHLATLHRIPATYSQRQYVEIGGLMSYGTNVADAFRQVGVYVGRILKGAKPAELPVVQATRFELLINTETARMLGVDVPPSLLAIADEVIE
jgi:putative ABC transport system substrate-binding protein